MPLNMLTTFQLALPQLGRTLCVAMLWALNFDWASSYQSSQVTQLFSHCFLPPKLAHTMQQNTWPSIDVLQVLRLRKWTPEHVSGNRYADDNHGKKYLKTDCAMTMPLLQLLLLASVNRGSITAPSSTSAAAGRFRDFGAMIWVPLSPPANIHIPANWKWMMILDTRNKHMWMNDGKPWSRIIPRQ